MVRVSASSALSVRHAVSFIVCQGSHSIDLPLGSVIGTVVTLFLGTGSLRSVTQP